MNTETRRSLTTLLVCSALPLTACLATSEPDAEIFSFNDQALATENGLTQNGLTQNGLTQNGLTQNGLTQNGLTQNGLLLSTLEQDAAARMLLTYIASCALPAGQSITLSLSSGPLTLQGELGLAPTWTNEHGTCDESCQRWVSGCVLSRINYFGDTIPLSLRGDTAVLTPSKEELASYPNREAAYFGNIFKATQERYACVSPGSTLISRVCGPDGAANPDCVVSVLGDCPSVCDSISPSDSSFRNCRSGLDATQTYREAITVFRRKSDKDNPL
jgi:hypothetical protein